MAGEELLTTSDRERMQEVLNIKEQANAKFKEADYFSAKCLYSGALELLERGCLHMEKADDTWEGIKNNMALCDLRRKEWTRVIDTTTEVLTRNPSNTKALYRRGVARIGHGKLIEAQRDLRAVVELEPDNRDARHKLAEAQQQLREQKGQERDQAEKLRGFLRGERLDDTVPVSEDGGVRKLHGNENAPLFSSWIKREWLSPNSGLTAVVTCHVVVKTQAGKEVWTSRKPPGSLAPQQVGPHMVHQAKPAQRPVEPVRFVLDDSWGGVFLAWNAAVKTLQINELGRFEVAKNTLGPSVEGAITRCIQTWLGDNPARREMFQDVPDDVQAGARQRQALQILGLPEELCLEPAPDPNGSLSMEMELLGVAEVLDLDGDGRKLLHVIREGKQGAPTVAGLSTVVAHFRIAKLLPNVALKDTRMGLANTSDGLVMREDKTKEPMEFVVGEEDAGGEGEFVPPCIGRCLMMPPGGVSEGMRFELILRDGVPVSEMEKSIHTAYATGVLDAQAMPDTSGPVAIRIEVEKVLPAVSGPTCAAWHGVQSLQQERERAEQLEALDDGRHCRQAVRRWRRILCWLEQLLEGRRWRVGEAAAAEPAPAEAGASMYNLEWDADEAAEGSGGSGAPAQSLAGLQPGAAELPKLADVPLDLLKELEAQELAEWAVAHTAMARLLAAGACAGASSSSSSTAPPPPTGGGEGAEELCETHARLAVKACEAGSLPRHLEVAARTVLGQRLLEVGRPREALEQLRAAQALDPTSGALRDQIARAGQQDGERRAVDMCAALREAKRDLAAALDADDAPRLLALLEAIDGMPLTWEVVSESAVGKEVGRCARHADLALSDRAKAIVGKLHKLAKEQRPLWVR